jgi:nicotinamide riboside transporter PnuC
MAKASFFSNHLKVRRKDKYLVVEARRICQHGHVLDEVFLTLPIELASLFTQVEQTQDSVSPEEQNNNDSVAHKRFKRFLSDN